jgi:hypothetical protein
MALVDIAGFVNGYNHEVAENPALARRRFKFRRRTLLACSHRAAIVRRWRPYIPIVPRICMG